MWNRVITTYDNPLDNIFSEFFNKKILPVSDVKANDKECVIIIELPGMDIDDVSIDIDRTKLNIFGNKKSDSKNISLRKSFTISYTLTDDLDADNISAIMKNGILEIKIPRMTSKQPKNTKVKIIQG